MQRSSAPWCWRWFSLGLQSKILSPPLVSTRQVAGIGGYSRAVTITFRGMFGRDDWPLWGCTLPHGSSTNGCRVFFLYVAHLRPCLQSCRLAGRHPVGRAGSWLALNSPTESCRSGFHGGFDMTGRIRGGLASARPSFLFSSSCHRASHRRARHGLHSSYSGRDYCHWSCALMPPGLCPSALPRSDRLGVQLRLR